MTQLSLPAPAKLNLFLHIIAKREDGYHELQTLFQFLDLADELNFKLRSDGLVVLENQLEEVPQADNLVWKAAELLAPLRPDPGLGVSIRLHKKLPMGGGLGAGSSDAATTLLALNQLWKLELSLDQLAEKGLQLGADVPVFVRGQTAWAEGVGEKLQAVQVPESHYLLIHPGCHCNTGAFFSHPRLPRSTPKTTAKAALQQLGSNDFTTLARELYPPVEACFQWLQEQDCQPWLTGTGACVFAKVSSAEQGQALLKQLPATFSGHPTQGWVVKSCQTSPTHQALAQA
ncbi:4-(cytidine 5'-diphospho)-2-C-methyl-D-erythritol kinase [Marinospirillum sp.]|uniref:4-(cytidine 5'-diphospho)-2-C-methyl-D-erythritol kinase n=1 Tax=Marinospirillum sp. TaxID=2183934 RepID=UPI00384E6AD1